MNDGIGSPSREAGHDAPGAYVDLYWLPLGAGGHVVRRCGRAYERVMARVQRRAPRDLYHAGLVVGVPEGRYVVEQAPVRDRRGPARGVVAEGPVGMRAAGRFMLFRYEVRCWRDGVIPDLAAAVASPIRLTTDPEIARRLLAATRRLPTPVWGRDELNGGEMWNSNSIVAWLATSAGLDAAGVTLPPGGRAPGWHAGVVVARRMSAWPPATPAS